MTDVRDTNPDATAHRRARFQIGWQHAVEDREYGEGPLSRLTWQNLGWLSRRDLRPRLRTHSSRRCTTGACASRRKAASCSPTTSRPVAVTQRVS